MKISTYIIIIFLILLFNCCKTKAVSLPKFDYDYEQNWTYFKLYDTLSIEIIKHIKAGGLCGTVPFASKTIGVVNKDTIRVINLCNLEDYKKGEIIKFFPGDKPSFRAVLPHSKIYDPQIGKFTGDYYDKKVIKTTYGYAIR